MSSLSYTCSVNWPGSPYSFLTMFPSGHRFSIKLTGSPSGHRIAAAVSKDRSGAHSRELLLPCARNQVWARQRVRAARGRD